MRASRVRTSWGRVAALAAVAALAVITMASCTSGPSSDSAESAFAAPSATGANPAPERGAAGSAQSAPGAGGEAAVAAGDAAAAGVPTRLSAEGSKVIKTADLTVRLVVEPVPDTDDAVADREANASARSAAITQAAGSVRGIATAAGGFQSSANGGGSQLAVSLRVPAEQYDAVVDKVTAIGELTNRTESSQDVTTEVVDVKSRVESMTASVARVRALLAQATNIADVIAIESELSVREANLESLQQQQAHLDGQVALSTVSITLNAVTDDPTTTEPTTQDTGFVAGIKAGWAALLGFFTWIGGAVGAVLPFVPLIAVAGLIVWWVIRRARRGRAPAGAAGPPVTPRDGASAPAAGEARAGEAPAGEAQAKESQQPAGVGSS